MSGNVRAKDHAKRMITYCEQLLAQFMRSYSDLEVSRLTKYINNDEKTGQSIKVFMRDRYDEFYYRVEIKLLGQNKDDAEKSFVSSLTQEGG